MSATLRYDGLEELKAALRQLVPDAAAEAETFIHGSAADAVNAMAQGYASHRRSRRLSESLTIRVENSGRFGVNVVVRNTAPHAWLFEHGSEARHTAIGANRGRMPATPVFIPEMERARRTVRRFLVELLERQGLTVTDAG